MAGMSSKTPRIAVLSAAPAASCAAVAACSFAALAQPDGNGRYLLQVTPGQDFTPSDGREMDVSAWRINAAIAAQVISRHNAAQPLVIDYEHQTLHKETNGQPAPAAGWIHGLRWIEGQGLFAEAELTERAKQAVDAKEYLYFSPVFLYAPNTGEVLKVTMGAFTNNPAIHGMQALNAMQAAASARFSPTKTPSEESMTLLSTLLAKLGLPDTTTEQAALTAVQTHKEIADAARQGLALKSEDGAPAVTAACTALTTRSPDPSKFVPVGALQQVQDQLAVLTAQQQTEQIEKLIAPALADGRILPALEPWARELGKASLAQLSAFLEKAPPVAALTSTQTKGIPPNGLAKGDAQLSADELAVCTAMGMSPEQYKAGASSAA
jgi:phage I-like protein